MEIRETAAVPVVTPVANIIGQQYCIFWLVFSTDSQAKRNYTRR